MGSICNAAAIVSCDAQVDLVDNGSVSPTATLVFYGGAVPVNVDAPLSGNTVLAQCAMSLPAFGSAVDVSPGARATANAVANDSAVDADGTPTFARALDRNGVARLQWSASELGLTSTPWHTGGVVSVPSVTWFVPES